MDKNRLTQWVQAFPKATILVVGDFFLDKYLIIDPVLDEPSLETGLTAYQITSIRLSPGAAGTVTNNLTALQVGKVMALGIIGQDGQGYELKTGLQQTGVDVSNLIETPSRFTPTYTKPLIKEASGEREINRLDIRNRSATDAALEDEIIQRLIRLAPDVDAIIALDQVMERNTGVITDRVRAALTKLGKQGTCKVMYADSRAFIGEFRNMVIKCNNLEVARVAGLASEDQQAIVNSARKMAATNSCPVCVTQGAEGQWVVEAGGATLIPAYKVEGTIDICGAGDATTAGTVAALACGAPLTEAAAIGNIVASITIQQLGTTGTATPAQVIERIQGWKLV